MRSLPYTLPIQPLPSLCLGSHVYELLGYISDASLCFLNTMEKEMATHSSILA